MTDACATCRFSIEVTAPHLVAQADRSYVKTKCRRYPVAVEVRADHWCGEFVAKDEPVTSGAMTAIQPPRVDESDFNDLKTSKGGRRGR